MTILPSKILVWVNEKLNCYKIVSCTSNNDQLISNFKHSILKGLFLKDKPTRQGLICLIKQ